MLTTWLDMKQEYDEKMFFAHIASILHGGLMGVRV
jgi:hypothetical protein